MIKTIMLFTLSACPMGRSMGSVLKEIKLSMPDIETKTVFIDVDPSITNHYRIKTNPTTLFLGQEDTIELGRLEGFTETENVLAYMREIQQRSHGELSPTPEENKPNEEIYTLCLIQHGRQAPVVWNYVNPTSVHTPRITAIRLLLKAQLEGYVNPFPASCELGLVEFKGKSGRVVIKLDGKDMAEMNVDAATASVTCTLKELGIHGHIYSEYTFMRIKIQSI